MAENTIATIREAEAASEELLRGAAHEAAQIVNNAQADAVLITSGAQDAARDKATAAQTSATAASRQALETALEDLGGEMATLAQHAEAKQPAAIRLIVNALV